jgi:hypothetical protein
MPLILIHRYCRADAQANPDVLWVFGDNEARVGYGGQAREMRGEPNAIGIATLAAPGRYWSDDNLARNCAVIDKDMEHLFLALQAGRIVVFPMDGVGTGLANLGAMLIAPPNTRTAVTPPLIYAPTDCGRWIAEVRPNDVVRLHSASDARAIMETQLQHMEEMNAINDWSRAIKHRPLAGQISRAIKLVETVTLGRAA